LILDKKSKGKALSAKLQRHIVMERNQDILSKQGTFFHCHATSFFKKICFDI
jgi:hypothetical protein